MQMQIVKNFLIAVTTVFLHSMYLQDYNRGDYQSICEELQLTDWDISISDDTTVCRNNFKKSVGLRRKVYTFLKI